MKVMMNLVHLLLPYMILLMCNDGSIVRNSLRMCAICTRWNSTFYMLQRCVLLKESIIHVLAESKYANLTPTDEQWLAAAKLCILLKPFQIATDFMQGEEYPTLGGISRYITTLIEGLQGSVPPPHWQLQSSWNSLPDAVKRVRSYILKDMKVRWDPADPLLGIAAIGHPGHKVSPGFVLVTETR